MMCRASREGSVQGYTGTQDFMETQRGDAEVCRDSWEHSQGHLSRGGGKLASVLSEEQENSFMVTKHFVSKKRLVERWGSEPWPKPKPFLFIASSTSKWFRVHG